MVAEDEGDGLLFKELIVRSKQANIMFKERICVGKAV